jgi:serine/threonine-protein kinase PknK
MASADQEPSTPAAWPPGYLPLERLSFREGVEVWRARRAQQTVALRLVAPDESQRKGELAAELDLLSTLRVEGVARLLEHGVTPSGGTFLAREWIAGEPLSAWARGRSVETVGALLAQVAERLALLHRAGFAHGDLSPSNVLVTADDQPVLVDFGLSGRLAHGRSGLAASGTFYAMSPERIAGAPPSARSDLFAFGAVLHSLFATTRRPAREFHARFPAEPFLVAAGTSLGELPPWSRSLVESLLARRPEARPASADEVSRKLRAALGLPRGPAQPPALEVPASCGREPFLAWLVESLVRAPREPLAVSLPAGDDAGDLVEALRVRATIAGLRTERFDPRRELGSLEGAGPLDHWAEARAATSGERWLLAALPAPDAWVETALQRLARARRQTSGAARVLLVGALPRPDSWNGWRVERAPEPRTAELVESLEPRIDAGSAERLERLAEALGRASGGSIAALERLLDLARARQWLVPGGERWTLRPGPLPDFAAAARERAPTSRAGLERTLARRLVAALEATGGSAEAAELAAVSGLTPAQFAAESAALAAHGWLELSGRELRLRRPAPTGLLEPAERRQLRRARAAWASEHGASPAATWLDRWLAEEGDRQALEIEWRERCAELRDAGAAELVLASLDSLARIPDAPLPADFDLERALCWASLGNAALAEQGLGEQEAQPSAPSRAARSALLRGAVARIRNDPEAARRHFLEASALDPAARLEAAVGRAEVEFAAGRDGAVIAAVDEIEATPAWSAGGATWRRRCDLARLRAVARQRAGDVERARGELELWLADAERRGDAAACGTLAMNLGTLERRSGEPRLAIARFERARDALRACGRVASEATARAQLGGALREAGSLVAAESELRQALAIRERLGDEAGAAAVRGLFALLVAERGHVAAAAAELERAVESFSAGRRLVSAPLLLARADLLRARVGRAPQRPLGESETAAIDPRVLLDRARGELLRGDGAAAAAELARARSLAERLSQPPVLAEAEVLAALVQGQRPEEPRGAHGSLLLDVRLWHALLDGDVDALALLARSCGEEGRDDRATRAWLGVAARCGEPARAARALAEAERHFEPCAAGLEPQERAALRRALLSWPDPYPTDLEQRASDERDPAELDMEILSLLELNHRLAAQEDLDGLLVEIVDSACTVTGAERGFLVLEEHGRLRLDAATECARGDVAQADVALSTSVVREALATMRTLNVSNAVDHPQLGAAPSVVEHELRSILCAPFRATEDLRGVVVVDHRLRTGAFGPRAEKLLGLLADQAALAFGQLRRRAQIQELNQRLAERVARTERDLADAKRALEERQLGAPGGGLIGSSAAMERVRGLIARVGPSALPVLLRGASGTGKELAARAIHDCSERSAGPFVGENVAALPAALIESELFGYRRGAFTGAERDRPGLFERADRGTLFLDEIGEMPAELQAKLLRVLETKSVRRLGDEEERAVDFRLLTATHRDLEAAVAAGTFRQDLYYRIGGVELHLPSLAERLEDIPELIEHFLLVEAASTGDRRHFAPQVVERLLRRAWPGNVRELRNEVRRLCVLSVGDVTEAELVRDPGVVAPAPLAGDTLPTLAELERQAIERALQRTGGDKAEAARLLGISRAKVYQRLKEWREEGAED